MISHAYRAQIGQYRALGVSKCRNITQNGSNFWPILHNVHVLYCQNWTNFDVLLLENMKKRRNKSFLMKNRWFLMLIGRKWVNFEHQVYQNTIISNKIDQLQSILHYNHVIYWRIRTIYSSFSTLKHEETAKLVYFHENYMILHVPMTKTGKILPYNYQNILVLAKINQF